MRREKSLFEKQPLATTCSRSAAGLSLAGSATGRKEVVSVTSIFKLVEGGK